MQTAQEGMMGTEQWNGQKEKRLKTIQTQIPQGSHVSGKCEGETEDKGRHFSGMCRFSFCFPIAGVYSRLSPQS